MTRNLWRWDQGRLTYLKFDNILAMAKVLSQFDQCDITEVELLFRRNLMETTGLPFAPAQYTIKRNYSRVFQLSGLATFIGNNLFVTDLCKELAVENSKIQHADEYLINLSNRFVFPFPAFQEYQRSDKPIYPFVAIIKLLIAWSETCLNIPSVSVEDVIYFVISNDCTGKESLHHFKTLKPKKIEINKDFYRQLRELMVFISQLSFLKMIGNRIYLDVESLAETKHIIDCFNPVSVNYGDDRQTDFLKLFKIYPNSIIIPDSSIYSQDYNGLGLKEGDRKRVEHFRIERSSLLKFYFRRKHPEPICDACQRDMLKAYPWTNYMLDIHHLLPLSMALNLTSEGTSLDDLVGICPNCHRAVHSYYAKWLTENAQSDFRSKSEAKHVYTEAVRKIII